MIPGLSIPITIDLQRLYGQKINLVQGENAGRRLAFTIVSGGVAVNLTGKILLLTGTKSDGSPVCLPITISSATTGQAYCDIVSGLVSAVGDATLQIRILTPAITGTATSGTTTSMYDTSKTWTANAYAGSWLYINSGTGINQARRIISNTATQLVVSDAWGTNPAAGSGYSIVTETGFSFPFTANVAASPDADAGIVQTGDFSVLTAAIATAYGLEHRIATLETADAQNFKLTGNQSAAGNKTFTGLTTFSQQPVYPNPSWIDIDLTGTGWTGTVKYKKVAGVVWIYIYNLARTTAPGGPIVVKTLPAGYRPGVNVFFQTRAENAPSESYLRVLPDGTLDMYSAVANYNYFGYYSYLAEG